MTPTPTPENRTTMTINPEILKWFQWISVNLGVAGVLFFLLYVGLVPSPLAGKIDAHIATPDRLIQNVDELTRTLKVLCAISANVNKVDATGRYYPPPDPAPKPTQ